MVLMPLLSRLLTLLVILTMPLFLARLTLKQMLRDFIGIRVNRAKKSGMVNITSSVNSRERSGINTILHEQIGRASCRERAEIDPGVGLVYKKRRKTINHTG